MQKSNTRPLVTRWLFVALVAFAPVGLTLGGCVATTNTVQNASDPHEHYVLFFETNSAELTDTAYSMCQHAALAVGELHAAEVTITGYSDRVGSEAENHQIAQRRTAIVQKTLVGLGVDPGIITTLPIGPADDKFGPTGDRRIEIRLSGSSAQKAGADGAVTATTP